MSKINNDHENQIHFIIFYLKKSSDSELKSKDVEKINTNKQYEVIFFKNHINFYSTVIWLIRNILKREIQRYKVLSYLVKKFILISSM